jgi:xylulokinase
MIANITGLVLTVPKSGSQGAALGAARLATLASDAGGARDVLTSARIDRTFEPDHTMTALYAERLEDYRSNAPTAV